MNYINNYCNKHVCLVKNYIIKYNDNISLHGWTPYVLGEYNMKKHKSLEEFHKVLKFVYVDSLYIHFITYNIDTSSIVLTKFV